MITEETARQCLAAAWKELRNEQLKDRLNEEAKTGFRFCRSSFDFYESILGKSKTEFQNHEWQSLWQQQVYGTGSTIYKLSFGELRIYATASHDRSVMMPMRRAGKIQLHIALAAVGPATRHLFGVALPAVPESTPTPPLLLEEPAKEEKVGRKPKNKK